MGISDQEFTNASLAELIHQKLLRDEFETARIDSGNPNALKDGIEVVTVDNTSNWWPRNPLAEIYAFRGREVNKLGWRNHIHYLDMPLTGELGENDNSDIHGTVYFVKRFQDGDIACTVRVHPGVDKFGRDVSMIGNNLPQLIGEGQSLPLSQDIYETSRIILDDERLPRKIFNGSEEVRNPDRGKVAMECLAASAIYSEIGGYNGYFCFMPERVWEHAYPTLGLEVQRLGPNVTMQDQPGTPTYDVYAGYMEFSPEALKRVSEISGIYRSSLSFGTPPEARIQQLLRYYEQMRHAQEVGQGLSDGVEGSSLEGGSYDFSGK